MRDYFLWALLWFNCCVNALECREDLPNSIENRIIINNNISQPMAQIKARAEDEAIYQFLLGSIYEHGLLGVKKDTVSAYHWYTKAAEKGVAAAQHQLGLFNLFCQGGNLNDAIYWFIHGNIQKMRPANMFYIAYTLAYHSKDNAEQKLGLESMKKMAIKKYTPAMFEYAKLLSTGVMVAKNPRKACELLVEAVELGYQRAFFDLAICHLHGTLGAKNTTEYHRLLTLSARFGDVRAIEKLDKSKEL